ncbi:MAG: DMT family transporter [Halofilum sp. (in: g-proteobacteria)]
MSQGLIVVLVSLVGIGVAAQAAMNAQLGTALQAPIGGALWNFTLGTIVLGLLLLLGIFNRPAPSGLLSAPWWAYLGGILGAIFVTTTILAVPRVGTAVTLASIICGQLIGAVLIDTFGWLGVKPIPLDPWRVAGVGMLIAGVVLVQHE